MKGNSRIDVHNKKIVEILATKRTIETLSFLFEPNDNIYNDDISKINNIPEIVENIELLLLTYLYAEEYHGDRSIIPGKIQAHIDSISSMGHVVDIFYDYSESSVYIQLANKIKKTLNSLPIDDFKKYQKENLNLLSLYLELILQHGWYEDLQIASEFILNLIEQNIITNNTNILPLFAKLIKLAVDLPRLSKHTSLR